MICQRRRTNFAADGLSCAALCCAVLICGVVFGGRGAGNLQKRWKDTMGQQLYLTGAGTAHSTASLCSHKLCTDQDYPYTWGSRYTPSCELTAQPVCAATKFVQAGNNHTNGLRLTTGCDGWRRERLPAADSSGDHMGLLLSARSHSQARSTALHMHMTCVVAVWSDQVWAHASAIVRVGR